MVYDASKSNLNKSLWAPNFGLPTVEVLTRSVDETCWMGDLDIGEMFLNFCLHPALQPFCGVDVKPYFPEEVNPDATLWEVWVRCMMGLKPSPYMCIKTLLLALEIIRGDKFDPGNPFHWDRIEFNLAAGESLCWDVMHAVSCKASYLGIQNATQKTRPPSTKPGPWAGSVVTTQDEGIGVKLSQDKWEKTKRILQHTLELIDAQAPLPLKLLESYRGVIGVRATYLPSDYPIPEGIPSYH